MEEKIDLQSRELPCVVTGAEAGWGEGFLGPREQQGLLRMECRGGTSLPH